MIPVAIRKRSLMIISRKEAKNAFASILLVVVALGLLAALYTAVGLVTLLAIIVENS